MDELLKETLLDFEGVEPEAVDASTSARAPDGRPPGTAPSRGPSLPKRGKAPSVDPIQPPEATEAKASQMPKLPPRKPKPAASSSATADSTKASLPPDVQKLANDLMRLIEEAGMVGEDDKSGDKDGMLGGLSPRQFSSSTLKSLAERARLAGMDNGEAGSGAAQQPEPSSSSGVAEEEEHYSSVALRGLAQQTKQTVKQQSKFARGEGAGQQPRPAGAAAGGGFPFGDILGALGGLGTGEPGADGDAAGGGMGFMVDYIMQNLLSKEVLYGPLKDIRDRYPPWLESHRESLSTEDLERYNLQYSSIQAVCKQYEEDPANFKRLVDLIQQMQTHGDPPSEIVDEMTGGMPAGLMGGGSGGLGGPAGLNGLDPDDLANFDIPSDFADFPKELQEKCSIQ